jgi:stress-induced morphogen
MPMAEAEIERLIRDHLPDAEVTIQDLAGDGDHYRALVVSEAFRGRSRVQQHQMVYAALQGRMGGQLHALALTTAVPSGGAPSPEGDDSADISDGGDGE